MKQDIKCLIERYKVELRYMETRYILNHLKGNTQDQLYYFGHINMLERTIVELTSILRKQEYRH